MSRGSQPSLGSQAVHAPTANPQLVQVSESTCMNLSLFKDIMKEYRKLDDSVTMRMNRNNAQFRDRERLGLSSKQTNPQDEACLYFWKELVANWKGRAEIITYCVKVVDDAIDERAKQFAGQEGSLDADRDNRARMYADEVKRNQIHNELVIENIVQKRALEAFKTRCKYFEPPLTDADARKWWDAASRY